MGEVVQINRGVTVEDALEAMKGKKLKNVLIIGEDIELNRSIIYDCDSSLTFSQANWLCDIFKDYILRAARL